MFSDSESEKKDHRNNTYIWNFYAHTQVSGVCPNSFRIVGGGFGVVCNTTFSAALCLVFVMLVHGWSLWGCSYPCVIVSAPACFQPLSATSAFDMYGWTGPWVPPAWRQLCTGGFPCPETSGNVYEGQKGVDPTRTLLLKSSPLCLLHPTQLSFTSLTVLHAQHNSIRTKNLPKRQLKEL